MCGPVLFKHEHFSSRKLKCNMSSSEGADDIYTEIWEGVYLPVVSKAYYSEMNDDN